MCLQKIDKIYNPASPQQGIGYKVVQNIHSNFMHSKLKVFFKKKMGIKYMGDTRVSNLFHKSKWNKDKAEGVIISNTGYHNCPKGVYPTGYHIFATLVGAKKWIGICKDIIVKVEYKDVVAIGKQNGTSKVIVARQFRILEEVKS